MKKKEEVPVRDENPGLALGQEEETQDDGGMASGECQETGESGEEEEQDPEEPEKTLTAVYPILYLAHQYGVGDVLPANDLGMVEAWIAAGTAAWLPPRVAAVKARPLTAEPGLPGHVPLSGAGSNENLVGKVPRIKEREKKG